MFVHVGYYFGIQEIDVLVMLNVQGVVCGVAAEKYVFIYRAGSVFKYDGVLVIDEIEFYIPFHFPVYVPELFGDSHPGPGKIVEMKGDICMFR